MKISTNDNRAYRTLTLDNGLKVLLVHDQDSVKAAASMAVNAGHFDDPLDRQGLAHFLISDLSAVSEQKREKRENETQKNEEIQKRG